MGDAAPPYDFTWAFVLVAQVDGTTRLLVRERYAYTRWWASLLVEPVEAVSFVMSQKMLRGIRDRAERDAAAHAGQASSPTLGRGADGSCDGCSVHPSAHHTSNAH
jgi:hypothetical protein